MPLYRKQLASETPIADAGSLYISTDVEGALQEVEAKVIALQGVQPAPTGNFLISGGGVAWTGSGLDFVVSPATYVIQGVIYTTSSGLPTAITLTAADPSDPRYDVFIVDTSGSVSALPGTPAADPELPDVDPATQLALSLVQVAAGATVPSNIVLTDVYHENAEWTTSRSGSTNTLASTNNPHSGTVDIEGTAVTTGNYFQMQAPSAIDPNTYTSLVFWIRSKATWAATRSLTITLRSAGNQRGTAVTFKEGSFGFVSSTTGSYQQIVIPMTLFSAGGLSVNQIRFTGAGSGTTIGYYFDDCVLQAGTGNTSFDPTALHGFQVWNTDSFYPANYVVAYPDTGGALYKSIVPNSGSNPSTSASWQLMLTLANVAKITVVNAYQKQQYSITSQLGATLSGTVTLDATASNIFEGTQTGNMTLGNPTNPADGMDILVRITIGGAGSYTIAYGSAWHFTAGQPTWPTTVGDVVELAATYYASNTTWETAANTPQTASSVAGGGTGSGSHTAYAPIFGGTTSTGALQSGTVGTSGHVLTSNGAGAIATFQAAASGSVSSVAASVPSIFSISGSPITTTGTLAMTYSGTALPVANGGTALTAGTSGGILAYTATGTLASSAALTANALVLGGGAGVVPSTKVGFTTDGTSALTLGVAGTSVGKVVFNNATSGSITVQPATGALGTVTLTAPATTGTLALTSDLTGGYQPLDSDLTTIAGLTATTDSFMQAKSSAWASRTVAQVLTDLQGDGLTSAFAGFRNIPQNSQSAAYTTVAADSGKHILHPSGDANARTFTIDSNANVAYPVGTAITFVNQTSQVVSIAITSDTLTLAGSTTSGTRSLAQNGVATAVKITSTIWLISGTGVT